MTSAQMIFLAALVYAVAVPCVGAWRNRWSDPLYSAVIWFVVGVAMPVALAILGVGAVKLFIQLGASA